MHRHLIVAASAATVLLLAACTTVPIPEPEEQRFAARQLDGIGLAVDDWGGQWRASSDEEAFGEDYVESQGGGPGGADVEQADPCTWSTNWLPDPTQFYTHSWRTYTTGDGATFGQDWITAVEPDADPAALLQTMRETLSACAPMPDPAALPDGTVTIVPDIHPQLGDGSFSYRADFAHPDYGGVYGLSEVHTVLCGDLWIHLSYIGYDSFIERDDLLAKLLERAAPLGGCSA